MLVRFNFANNLSLTYELRSDAVTIDWAKRLSQSNIGHLECQEYSGWHGPVDDATLYKVQTQLIDTAATLGFIPVTVQPEELTAEVLNDLHVNFADRRMPKHLNMSRYDLAKLMHRMNQQIHWLEHAQTNRRHNNRQCLLNLDFNHTTGAHNLLGEIPTAALDGFSAELAFGSLHIHYVYIGRHFLEMYEANDQTCPSRQFRPQRHYNTSCGLVFAEPHDVAEKLQDMERYYKSRGSDFWPYEFNDPRMCNGFYQLGQLVGAKHYTAEQRQQLRAMVASTTIVSWEVDVPLQ